MMNPSPLLWSLCSFFSSLGSLFWCRPLEFLLCLILRSILVPSHSVGLFLFISFPQIPQLLINPHYLFTHICMLNIIILNILVKINLSKTFKADPLVWMRSRMKKIPGLLRSNKKKITSSRIWNVLAWPVALHTKVSYFSLHIQV